jgi:hypothetical protein
VLLQQIDVTDTAHRLTVEDAQLVRNALAWLGLFDIGSARRLRGVLSRLQVPRSSQDFPLLKLEWHVLQYLQARRDGENLLADDFRVSLAENPLWRSPDLCFRSLIDSVEGAESDNQSLPASLQRLAHHLRQLVPEAPPTGEPRVPILVDLVHSQITDRYSGEKLVSEAACLALDRLRRENAVTCEQFVQICFNFRQFDPLIHTGKIFNLLSRIKRVLGESPGFRMKAGKILVEGNWDRVEFREAGARVNLAPLLSRWEKQLVGEVPAQAAPAKPHRRSGSSEPRLDWDWSQGLTRADLENRLGTPRSTTNRVIARWVSQGRVRARGKARGTRYLLLEPKPVPTPTPETSRRREGKTHEMVQRIYSHPDGGSGPGGANKRRGQDKLRAMRPH